MKLMIWLGIAIGGGIGGAVGALFDGGLGVWSITLSSVGSLAGIWAGFKIGKLYF